MSDSDDDDPVFSFLKPSFTVVYDEIASDEADSNSGDCPTSECLRCCEIETAWLNQNQSALEELLSTQADLTSDERATITLVLDMLNGTHISMFSGKVSSDGIKDTSIELVRALVQSSVSSEAIRQRILDDVAQCPPQDRHCRCLKFAVLGSLLMEMYCQANYTGPEFSPKDLTLISGLSDDDEVGHSKLFENALTQLECDGDYPFPICYLPNVLLVSRCILSLLAAPECEYWSKGVTIDIRGDVHRAVCTTTPATVVSACGLLRSRHWRSARAAVVHLRLLQKQSFENIPTLWKECSESFLASITSFGLSADPSSSTQSVETDLSPELQCQLWLEWGLCQHYFEYKDKGKLCFQRAQTAVQLHTFITAAPGRRTKYQRNAVAQLYVKATSSLVPSSVAPPASETIPAVVTDIAASHTAVNSETTGNTSMTDASNTEPSAEATADASSVQPDTSTTETVAEAAAAPAENGWVHSEWEMGRRLVRATERGEEAALREIKLDECDGGAAENIIIEGGPKFADEVDTGGQLHCLDQAVLLSLCLDVANSNPVDGLTNEEMLPYIERVLAQANNWMIHSMGLLQRSWLEYERRKTADRALLQMQALLDQHTTRLTITQSTYKSIEESAGSAERLRYIHCIAYPAQYEFKRDLANKYLRYEVLSSALNLFKELQMWDEVVTCYQLMDKPQRAELVVRDRLKLGATPYMLTSLGDLTKDEECYEQAWLLSKGRFARAKRTLARICFDRKEYSDSIRHMSAALAVHPLVASAWYLQGLACMHVRDWRKALESFTRCVQQDMEIGEAWANMGAIYMELKELPKAHVSFVEALKHKRDSWKIIENLLFCSLELSKWYDVILYSNMLLDQAHKLKAQAQSPVHIQALRRLIMGVMADDDDSDEQKVDSVAAETKTAVSAPEGATPDDLLLENLSLYNGANTVPIEMRTETEVKPTPSNEKSAEATRVRRAHLIQRVEKLLTRMSNTVDSDAAVWDAVAVFYTLLGKPDEVKDARVKEFRALLTKPGWAKETTLSAEVAKAAGKLVDAHSYEGVTKLDIYGCKSMLQSALTALRAADVTIPEIVSEIERCLTQVEKSQ